MPFIRGRYHINAVAGEALEAAREAEAALLALEHAAQTQQQNDDDADFTGVRPAASAAKGPIHRVEIEAAEMVPAHSGRAAAGFVARVHRAAAPPAADDDAAPSPRPAGKDYLSRVVGSKPETHVFADHRDLVNFLRDEFAKDCKA